MQDTKPARPAVVAIVAPPHAKVLIINDITHRNLFVLLSSDKYKISKRRAVVDGVDPPLSNSLNISMIVCKKNIKKDICSKKMRDFNFLMSIG